MMFARSLIHIDYLFNNNLSGLFSLVPCLPLTRVEHKGEGGRLALLGLFPRVGAFPEGGGRLALGRETRQLYKVER